MLQFYHYIHAYLAQLSASEMKDLFLTPRNRESIDHLCSSFEEVESVTKSLQSDSTKWSQVLELFHTLTCLYPYTKDGLLPSAKIVECPDFESALR